MIAMKKYLLPAALLIGFLSSVSSCTKDYTCRCTVSSGGMGSTVTFPINNATQKEAEDACNGYAAVPGAYSGCSLD